MSISPGLVAVYTDAAGRDFGRALAAQLTNAGRLVRSIDCMRFPIADSMPSTLMGLAEKHALVVVVLSDSENSVHWISKELTHAEALYPSFLLAVMPSFPRWRERLDERSLRVLPPGADVTARVDQWFTSTRSTPQ